MKKYEIQHMLGQAGVYRTAAELALKGMPVWFPGVDFGSDLMTSTGKKIQVKTARLAPCGGSPSAYSFQFTHGRERREVDVPDFHVLWGWDEKCAWVLPSRAIGWQHLTVTPKMREPGVASFSNYESSWKSLTSASSIVGGNHLNGRAAEYLAISELLGLGVPVTMPVVDLGFDLLAVNGLRIQVKAANLYSRRNETPYYLFHLNPALGRDKDKTKKGAVQYSLTADIFVLCGLDEKRFWIVPAVELDYLDTLTVGNEARWVDPEPVRKLRDAGKSYAEIGQELGIGTMTAWKKINLEQGGREVETAKLKAYENRWDLIAGHARLMAESEAERTDALGVVWPTKQEIADSAK